ncbi:MAG: alkylation response protein AidB-like acyl-CoA dehydrogenase [Pirellulaceae bacterium]|jgi:alkylation response protein AidB-like acyl-CoA dehydrogenase
MECKKMSVQQLQEKVVDLATEFSRDRGERQRRRSLDRADFQAIAETGYLLLAIPESAGGHWVSVEESVRPICSALRALAKGDSSVALVSAMHPAVLSYWFGTPQIADSPDDPQQRAWDAQCQWICETVRNGDWWGTITSEPGSGGDVAKTKATAQPTSDSGSLNYQLSGQKHFGSGSGMLRYMVTTAIAQDEGKPDWFFLDTKDVPFDGSQGVKMIAEWDGHGMPATQSHALAYEDFPATRIAWKNSLGAIAMRSGGFIGCLFTSVIVGIVEQAMELAREKTAGSENAFVQVEMTRAETEYWLIQQAFDGMQRAVEQEPDPRKDVLLGKTGIAELSESVLKRLCQALGGGTFSRHSPFGYWFEDVRALGFLRPPWALAFDQLKALLDE